MRTFWNRRSRRRKILIIAGAVVAAIALLPAIPTSNDDGNEAARAKTQATTTEATTQATTTEATTTAASEPTSGCAKVPPKTVAAIAEGLTTSGRPRGTLRNGAAALAETGEDFRGVKMRIYLVSADIQAPGMEGSGEVATWAVTRSLSVNSMGLIVAVDSFASEFSDWGEAARSGSPVDDWRDSLRDDDAYDESRSCAGD